MLLQERVGGGLGKDQANSAKNSSVHQDHVRTLDEVNRGKLHPKFISVSETSDNDLGPRGKELELIIRVAHTTIFQAAHIITGILKVEIIFHSLRISQLSYPREKKDMCCMRICNLTQSTNQPLFLVARVYSLTLVLKSFYASIILNCSRFMS